MKHWAESLLVALAIGAAGAAFAALPNEDHEMMSADEVSASAVSVTPGITPKTGAQAAIGTTFPFTVVSVAPVDATVLSRSPAVASVDSIVGDTTFVSGVSVGTSWIVASVFNGHCTIKDSALITVIDTTTIGEIEGDSARGRLAWLANCQSCHTADKAWDLELFNYNSVIRRAMAHVDTLTALDIVEHVATLGAGGPLDSLTQLFQPGTPATKVASDSMFAVTLFDADEWRTSLTRDSLLAQDIGQVRIPIDLPRWSDESSRYDWLPGIVNSGQLPPGVLNSSLVQNRFVTYRANPTMTNVRNLISGIHSSAHNMAIPDAPCSYDASNQTTRFTDAAAQACFDQRKWGSSLCYINGIRLGISADSILGLCEAGWWETGHMAHKAQQRQQTIDLRSLQSCSWIYLGTLATGALREASLYMTGPCGNGVDGLGHKRWASWLPMWTMVRRQADDKGSTEVCRDIWAMTDHGHTPWFANAVAFGLREMMYRLDNSQQTVGARGSCTNSSTTTSSGTVTGANGTGYLGVMMNLVNNKAGSGVFNTLKPLADSVRARINAL